MGAGERAEMVQRQLAARGLRDARVLAAFRDVPREAFVPPAVQSRAFADEPLPIGEGQTISQPYIVAATAEALQLTGRERLLEVGTGSGYAAAIFSRLAREVVTLERHPALAAEARARLRALGFDTVQVHTGDGSLGWPPAAPFDAIAVAAGAPHVPPQLKAQLAIGGRLVIPVGAEARQVLLRLTRRAKDEWTEEPLIDVRFVPLIGAAGWADVER